MAETTQTETTTVRTEEIKHEPKKSTLVSDIVAIVGFAILIVIIIWGLVNLTWLLSGVFSSLFYHPASTIQVSVPSSVTSGDQMTVSWNYSPSVSGSYAFLYECKNGLQFQTKNPVPNATSTTVTIPCGVAYSAAGNDNSLALVPRLSAGATSTLDTLSIVFIPSQTGSQVQGSASLTINPVAQTQPIQPTTPTQPVATQPTPTYPAPQYAGPADLSVRIISEYADGTGAGVVSFDIANIGGSTSGSYYFSAQLPTAQSYPYVSPTQAPLAPGSHIVDTLRFTDIASGGGIFSVNVVANDANYGNNSASVEVAAPYNINYNNYNGYNPGAYTVYPTYTY